MRQAVPVPGKRGDGDNWDGTFTAEPLELVSLPTAAPGAGGDSHGLTLEPHPAAT